MPANMSVLTSRGAHLPVLFDEDTQKKQRRPARSSNAMVLGIATLSVLLLLIYFGSRLFPHSSTQRSPAKATEAQLKAVEQDGVFLQELLAKELTESEQKEKDKGYEDHAFNLFISDRLSLHRHFPDLRQPECFNQVFDVSALPTASVIIIFHNEARSTLLRTIHSVRDKSPPMLLKEIILVNDASNAAWWDDDFRNDIKDIPKTRLINLDKRQGLIRAKIQGAHAAIGNVLVFLDSHCECTYGWLEPLLDRVHRDRTTIAMPVIDVINTHTFEYEGSTEPHQRGVFTWDLTFTWDTPLILQYPSPTMAGGLFAMDRKYFDEVGAYDLGMEVWGGENLEMSFRVWMCGGRLEIVPCSRVGHVFRDRAPYKYERDPGITIGSNLNRVASVWMDEFAQVYYKMTDNERIGFGNVTDRVKLRADLKCKSFEWYLDAVYPEMFVPVDDRISAKGALRNAMVGQCMDTVSDNIDTIDIPELFPCEKVNPRSNQYLYLTRMPRRQLRHESAHGSKCLSPEAREAGSLVRFVPCQDDNGWLQWHLKATGHLRHASTGLCLDLKSGEMDPERGMTYNPVIAVCKRGHPRQKWAFTEVHGEDIETMDFASETEETMQ